MDALRTAFDPLELSSRSPSARIQRLSSPPSCSPSSILDTAVYSVSSDFAKLTAMSTFTLKTRHYAALSSRLRNLGQNLSDTEHQLGALAEHLQAMSKLGVNCGAQFMAVSRLLDLELRQAEAAETDTLSGQSQRTEV